MTPEQRFDHTRAAQARPAAEIPPAAAGISPDPNAPPTAPSAEKIKVGKYELSETEVEAMMTRQAADDLRKATAPATAADYKLALPEDLQLPGGVQFTFDEANNGPTFDAARAWAHSKGLTQGDFSEMLSLYAGHAAQQDATLAERSRAEIAKAGVNAPQRMAAIGKWISAEMGQTDARPIFAGIVTDAQLRFYEKMMTKITGQGVASFSQQHRVPHSSAPTDEEYESWSYAEKREYSTLGKRPER